MKRPVVLLLLLVLLMAGWGAACGPAGGEPVFDARLLTEATSLPIPAATRVIATLPERILAFDISSDGRTLALAARGEVLLYDLGTYKLLRSLKNGELNSSLAWSWDGSRLAVGGAKDYGKPFFTGGDSTNSSKAHLTVYDAQSWKVVLESQFGDEMVNQMFWDIAWSPDGRSLAFSPDIGGVYLLDAQTGRLLSHQGEFSGTVTDIAWSPDGTRLVATNDQAYGIRRWRVSDNEAVRLFDQRASRSIALAWSPDGKRIASGHSGGGVCLWTAATNRCDGFIHAHLSATFSLAWSPDGQQIVTGGGVIRTWDANTGALIRSFGELSGWIYDRVEWPAQAGPVVSLASSFEDPGETTLRLWDPQSGIVLAEWRGNER